MGRRGRRWRDWRQTSIRKRNSRGPSTATELEPYFAEADLFVLPGTGGLAVQEAMAHGLPVIVAKGDGTQDDLVRDGNGWQIAPENQAALTEALREALSDMKRLRKMGEEFVPDRGGGDQPGEDGGRVREGVERGDVGDKLVKPVTGMRGRGYSWAVD